MKVWVLVLAVVLLAGVCSGVPTVERVLVSPLYANAFNTLSCVFVSNESSPTASYRWYDSCSGIWVSGTSSKSSLTTGCVYNCSVNLTGGGASTGFYNASNLVTVAASCLNPLPFRYCSYNLTNVTALLAAYPESSYRHAVFGDLYAVSNATGNYRYFANGCLFFGGYIPESGVNVTNSTIYVNHLSGKTAYGDINYDLSTTDGNWSTYDERVSIVGSRYSRYYLNNTLPAGSVVYMSIGLYTVGGATTTTVSVMTNQTDGGGNTTLCSYSLTGAAIGRYNYNCSAVLSESSDDIIFNLTSTVATSYGGIWEIMLGGSNIIPSDVLPQQYTLDNIDDFTQSEGALYNFSYLDEETRSFFNLTTTGVLNSSDQRVYCSSTVTERNVSGQVGAYYVIGVKEIPSKIENLLYYDDGSDYYRRMSFCDRYKSFGQYLINTSTHTATLFTFTIDDQSGSGQWEDGMMCISRYLDTVLEDVSCDNWQADNTIPVYLIANREYSLSLISDDCSEERNIGWVTASPADTSKTITISSLSFNTSTSGIIKGASWGAYWDNSSSRVNSTFVDADDEVVSYWWGVYESTNDSLMYSDNTTTDSYLGSYLGISNHTYYVKFILETEEGDVFTFIDGNLRKVASGLMDFLDYEGEYFMGLESKTFFLFGSLGAMGVTALMAGPLSVGVAAVLLVVEAFTFSVFGWLPFMSSASTQWPFILASVGIVALLLHYTRGGQR